MLLSTYYLFVYRADFFEDERIKESLSYVADKEGNGFITKTVYASSALKSALFSCQNIHQCFAKRAISETFETRKDFSHSIGTREKCFLLYLAF